MQRVALPRSRSVGVVAVLVGVALFAVGPSVTRLVEQHVADLSAGRTVLFRMVVVNRLETSPSANGGMIKGGTIRYEGFR